MEGLNHPRPARPEESAIAEHRTIERWLAVLFLLMVGVVAVSSLVASLFRGGF